MELVYEKEDLLIADGGKDNEYNFYPHAGIGVAQPRARGPRRARWWTSRPTCRKGDFEV